MVTTDGFGWSLFSDPEDREPRYAFLPDLKTSAAKFFDALEKQLPL